MVTKKVTTWLYIQRNNLKLESFNLKRKKFCNCNHLVTDFVTTKSLVPQRIERKSYKVTASK